MKKQPENSKVHFQVAGTEFIVDSRYQILKQIGVGAYGVVVSAVDKNTSKKYAIKKVKSDIMKR